MDLNEEKFCLIFHVLPVDAMNFKGIAVSINKFYVSKKY